MLRCEGIRSGYGGNRVISDLSLEVQPNKVTCIVGRNGVGKSTLLKTLIGLVPLQGGEILFNGNRLTGFPPHRVARAGIGYVPEERRVFADLTVEENLEVARRGSGPWSYDAVYKAFPPLGEFRTRKGGNLSGGQQQMLTIGRTLVGNPSLLLVDEPTEGLSPIVVEALEQFFVQLKESAATILLTVQDLGFALRISDQLHIMDRGEIVWSGSNEDARKDLTRLTGYLTV